MYHDLLSFPTTFWRWRSFQVDGVIPSSVRVASANAAIPACPFPKSGSDSEVRRAASRERTLYVQQQQHCAADNS
ncbi:hypothetical protein BaRGS_00002522 [Batillaria attramentaria]|uniref:Uncharacterized protein n=1 Tax=Batillaria attramentaria TaxID=370345 RepID=A0ABD0M434_9CAEN